MKRCQTCNTIGGDNQTACYSDGQPLVDDPLATTLQEAIGEKYALTKLIGKGAMGAVYGAHHRDLGDVAIKVMLARTDDQTLSERFLREARALRKLRHQNAVLVYDLDRSPAGVIYMVMEMVAGRSLGQDLRERKRLSLDETMEVAEAVCAALAAAHERGIIHRDLKPHNILRAEEQGLDGRIIRTIKIADFGIVKHRVKSSDDTVGLKLTKMGKPVGTPFYMSPEQWFGDSPGTEGKLDHRTDIYALGCTLYELLAGRPPFIGRTSAEMRRQHLHETPQPLHELAPQVPLPISHVIMRALAKDRDERQQTATEFIHELRAAYDKNFQLTDRKLDEERLRAAEESLADEHDAEAAQSSNLRDTEEAVPMFLEKVTTLDPGLLPAGPEPEASAPRSGAANAPAEDAPIPQPPPAPGFVYTQVPADKLVSNRVKPPIEQTPSMARPAAASEPRRKSPIIFLVVLLFTGGVAAAGAVYYLFFRTPPTPIASENVSSPQPQFKPPLIPMSQLMGTLRIKAEPGSEIFVDDEKAGTAGTDGLFVTQVPAGLRNVRVAAKGYRLWIKDARISPNQQTTLTAARVPPVQLRGSAGSSEKKDSDTAEAEYRALLKNDANNTAAHKRLGLILLGRQRYSEAIVEFETAVRLDPQDTEAKAALVRLYLLKGRDAEVAPQARALVRLKPRDASAHHLLARALLRAPGGKLDEALSEIEIALSRKQTAEFLETKAYVLLARNSFDEALKVAQRAVELDRSKMSAARAAVAVILFRMERVDEAVKIYRELRQADKNDRWGDIKRIELQRAYSRPVLETLSALIARTN